MIFILSFSVLWTYFPQFRFFAPFLIFCFLYTCVEVSVSVFFDFLIFFNLFHTRLLKPAARLAHKSPFIFRRGTRIAWFDVLHNRINVQTNRRKGSSSRGSGWQHCRRLSPKSLINPNIGFSRRSTCRADTSSNTVTANTVQRCGYRARVRTVALMLQSYHQGTDWNIVCRYIVILMIHASYIGRKHGFIFVRGV